MSNINITLRIDEDIKARAEGLFDELGLTFSAAVNVFVRQCLREQGIPFKICLNGSADGAGAGFSGFLSEHEHEILEKLEGYLDLLG